MFLGILLVATLVTAQVVSNNRTLRLSEDRQLALESKGITNYQTVDKNVPGGFERCLYKYGSVTEGPVDFEGNNFTRQYRIFESCHTFPTENESFMDLWEERYINNLADQIINRSQRSFESIRGGETTLGRQ